MERDVSLWQSEKLPVSRPGGRVLECVLPAAVLRCCNMLTATVVYSPSVQNSLRLESIHTNFQMFYFDIFGAVNLQFDFNICCCISVL
jgi:hypothetical protein